MKQLELMDENDNHMEQMKWDGDNGIEITVHYVFKHTNIFFCYRFQLLTTKLVRAANASIEDSNEATLHQGSSVRKQARMEKDTVPPCSGELRMRTHDQLSKCCKAGGRGRGDKLVEVGEVAQVPLQDMDKKKLMLTLLLELLRIVQVDKSCGNQIRVAKRNAAGLLTSWYVYHSHRLGHITENGIDVLSNGLSEE